MLQVFKSVNQVSNKLQNKTTLNANKVLSKNICQHYIVNVSNDILYWMSTSKNYEF